MERRKDTRSNEKKNGERREWGEEREIATKTDQTLAKMLARIVDIHSACGVVLSMHGEDCSHEACLGTVGRKLADEGAHQAPIIERPSTPERKERKERKERERERKKEREIKREREREREREIEKNHTYYKT